MAFFTQSAEWYARVAKGEIPGYSVVHKFGSGLLTTSLLPITQTNTYPTPTTAQSLEFVSSGVADAQNGVGAREITFVGLDANWNEQTVTVATHATNGTTAVAITGTWVRLYQWYVSQSGTYATQSAGSHAGILTVRIAGAGATWSTIPISPFPVGQSQIGVHTIPTGYTGYLISKDVTVDSSKVTDIYFFQRPFANDVTTPFTGTMKMIEREINVVNSFTKTFHIPKGPFVGPCDIGFMGKVSVGTGEVAIEYELILIQNGY